MMGTWGYRTFEDDLARDWLYELEEAEGVELLVRSLSPEAGDDEFLSYEDGVHILAAAEIIYGILNQPREGLPNEAVQWIDANKDADVSCLKPMCEGQIGCVLYKNSELRQQWEENADLYPEWKAHVESLWDAMKD